MKLIDKYRKLQNKAFVKEMVTRSVYASMQLENQGVAKGRIEELYAEVLENLPANPGYAAAS